MQEDDDPVIQEVQTYYENWVEAIFAAMLNAKINCCTACNSLVI